MMTVMNLFRRLARFGAVAIVGAALVGPLAAPVAAARNNTPENEILVVTANIEEAYSMDNNDLADNYEIDNFAARIKQVVPKTPDVLLLQEVNHRTAALTASRLTARLGQKFVVGVRPDRNTTVEYPDKQVHTETAIILNAETMATANGGGYFATTYPKSAAPVGERVQVRRQAFMLAREKGSGALVPLVSLHYAMERSLRTAKLSNYYRGKWSKQLKSLLARRYEANSDRRAAVIAGDFNAGRCYKGDFANCIEAAWWRTMERDAPRYIEAGRAEEPVPVPYGVDAIWTRGNVIDAGWDEHGDFPDSDRSRFYSDHRLRWAVVAPKNV